MFQLRCIVRDCQELLQRRENVLCCAAGHHFDRARQGYWPLIQPQDRKSSRAGDSDAAVVARQRWLERGYASGLVDALRPWLTIEMKSESSHPPRTLDLGCGEGTFGRALFTAEASGYCGIDLSKRAIKLAARSWTDATWVLSNADRILPALDGSVDRVISLFGRRPAAEISRVLAPHGICIVAVPGAEDLMELREHVQLEGSRRSRWTTVVEELSLGNLQLLEHQLWQQQIELDANAIRDAMAMTYRAVRRSQQARLLTLSSQKVTLAADLLMLGRVAD